MATISATFSHWTRQIGVQKIAPVYQPTSLFGLNGVRTMIVCDNMILFDNADKQLLVLPH
jgi:hypothetical protein